MEGNWHVHGHAEISGGIEFLKTDVQRIALGTTGLLIQSHAMYVKAFEDGLIEERFGFEHVFRPDAKFDSADEVRDEPVEANEVFVAQETFNARRFQAALGQQRLWKIAELADGHERPQVELLSRFGVFVWNLEVAVVEFVLQRFPGRVGQRLRLARQMLQFIIGHGGVSLRQTDALAGLLQIGHEGQNTVFRAECQVRLLMPRTENDQSFSKP